MEFSTEWKSLWPISSTPSAPLHIPNKNSETHFGPVIFTPKPNSSTTLLHSPSFSPSLPPQYQQLSLSRFLQNYDCIPSSANSISSLLGPELPNYSSCFHSFNSLQLLQIPNKDSIIAFFPTGENFDEVGFSLLSVKEGILSVQAHQGNSFQKVKEGNVNHQRITRLLVNPVVDVCCDDHVAATVGLLMVCTIYSVCWYRIEISTSHIVCLDYLGGANAKMLKGNAVVCACWSPHLNEECLVLLENGDLLLFDVSYPYGGKVKPMSLASDNSRLVNKKMHLSLTDKMGLEKQESDNGGRRWFFCEFSWHPRIFIVSHCNAVFLVDLRYARKCYIGCLLKLEMLSIGKNDEFYALSKAGNDGFTFTVSTRHLLLLCDVRKPLMPVLRWTHGIENPQYMTVLRLSELRANAQDTRYELASEAGYCIILGSFWDNDFSLFCYGPYGKGNGPIRAAEISYYAWGLPSKLSLSGSNCNCANCLVREEFLKASLPSWVDWRQKKPLVLGFSILEPSLSAQLCSPNDFGSFMVLKLMSSGNLEAQAYISGWESENISEADHNGKNIYSEDNLSYNSKYSEYDGGKRFQHLELEFLYAYMEDKLAEHIVKRREKKQESTEASQQNCSVRSESNVHQEVCHRLKDFGLPRVRPSLEVSTVLKDIRLPTSIHEIALRSMCVGLPTNLLQLASPAYSDLDKNTEKEPLGFVDVSDVANPRFSLLESHHTVAINGRVKFGHLMPLKV